MILIVCGIATTVALLIFSLLTTPFVNYQLSIEGPGQKRIYNGFFLASQPSPSPDFNPDEVTAHAHYTFPVGFPVNTPWVFSILPGGRGFSVLDPAGILSLGAMFLASVVFGYVTLGKLGRLGKVEDEDDNRGDKITHQSKPEAKKEISQHKTVIHKDVPGMDEQITPVSEPPGAEKTTKEKCIFGDFVVRDIIGEGQFGTVYRAREKRTGQICILKEIDKEAVENLHKGKFPADQYKQLEIMELLAGSVYCAKLFNCMESKDFLYIISPCHGRDLSWLLFHCEGKLEEPILAIVTGQVACGLEYMHRRGLIHSYVTPDNIYLSDTLHATLGNFSRSVRRSKSTHRGRWGYIGSYPYTAPEIPRGEPYNECIDWWNVGILTYQATYGFTPFQMEKDNISSIQARVLNEDLNYPQAKGVSTAAVDFIKKLLMKEPDRRLGNVHCPFGSVFEHRFYEYNRVTFTESNNARIVAPSSIPVSGNKSEENA